MNSPAGSAGFWRRWPIYFAERFPPLKHGLLIGAFCFGLLGYAARAGELPVPLRLPVFALAFVSVFLMFLQLRILDEFKDYEDDCRWRPYRPVPRGLITLAQLRRLWLLAAAIQIGAAWWLDARLLGGLLAIWLYSALMGVEFFVRDWLRAHPLVYMLSHIVIVPLMALYVLACQGGLPAGAGGLLAASYFAFCVIEVGRKIRAPDEEEAGVETYTALWGRPGALAAWLGFMVLGSLGGIGAAAQIGAGWLLAGLLGLVLVVAAWQAAGFLSHPVGGERFNRFSGAWTLALFLGLGFLALFGKGGA